MTGGHAPRAIERWQPAIERALRASGHGSWRVLVLRETASTQDAARSCACAAGTVVTAWRQTAGRGRVGRSWHDPRGEGVAVTFAAAAGAPEILALAPAVGTAEAVEALTGRPCGLKWPNDVLVEGRKLAGVLVEQSGPLAWIGIGLNVSQASWPADLAARAVSLRQLGAAIDRLDALEVLVPAVIGALGRDLGTLRAAWDYRTSGAGRARPRPSEPIQPYLPSRRRVTPEDVP
jgi:BirA family biotin operon repressor/biotin-[acetyl-CoA-carboxylase] ligase